MNISRLIKKHYRTIVSVAVLLFLAAATAAIAAGGGGHAEPKGWVITDTYKVLNFLVLATALFFIAKKPVVEFFTSRQQGIREELEDLEKQKSDAEKELATFKTKIAELDKERETIIADYVSQGEEAKKRILEEAESQAEKLEEMAKRNIEQEFKSAKAKLQQEIAEKALAQAEILVKESISAEDQDRLVDDYLDKVVAS